MKLGKTRRVKITYLIFQAGMASGFPGIACLWVLVAKTKGRGRNGIGEGLCSPLGMEQTGRRGSSKLSATGIGIKLGNCIGG